MSDKNPENQADVDNPQWEQARHYYDWRNYIGRRCRNAWHSFTPELRMMLAADADDLAGLETPEEPIMPLPHGSHELSSPSHHDE